ncbi:hypothetical protein CQW23_27321 [Capsicum baccatum]|uniref:Uncharacterized protein n=1 Tax=Capsicum baccatum TaxID=33114 RepID=A0A2G2VDB2_CAPBA|nr:hypothetical protein CQW23_27321 [Capsicum baccatum]
MNLLCSCQSLSQHVCRLILGCNILMSICFVPSWYIGFVAICKANLLSLKTSTGRTTSFPISFIKPRIQTNSAVTAARLLNSASAELLEKVVYFFDFQETSDSPTATKYPVTDLLV